MDLLDQQQSTTASAPQQPLYRKPITCAWWSYLWIVGRQDPWLASPRRAPPTLALAPPPARASCSSCASPSSSASRSVLFLASSTSRLSPYTIANHGCFNFDGPRSSHYHSCRDIRRPPCAPPCHAGCERATTSASLNPLHQLDDWLVEKEEQILHRAQVGLY